MRHIRGFVLVGVLAIAGIARSEELALEIPANLILERFAVAKDGADLLVPVNVTEKSHPFIVDTGATITVFDTSFPLGRPVDSVPFYGAEGNTEVKLYNPPAATLGKLSLGPLEVVAGRDLKAIRQVSGNPIQGILGMDFLGKYVIHIDVDKGELLLLKSAPRNAGEELPMLWGSGGLPYVTVGMAPAEPFRFLIDTGRIGQGSGNLGVFEIGSLAGSGTLHEVGTFISETISGTASRREFQGGVLKLGGFQVQSPIFGESHGQVPNVLGMGFWSRFLVTYDFPERKVYLRRSAGYGRPDRRNATGLRLWRKNDSIEVHSVVQHSPAFRAGLKEGDVLLELDGLVAEKTSLFALRQVLCNGGPLSCVVRRDTQERRVSIDQRR
jgi:hypothetical protein